MKSYSVTARGLSAVQVRGANWITALGQGLEALGRASGIERLACEVLQNGTVIARDIATGTGYIVQEVEVSRTSAGEVEPGDEVDLVDITAEELGEPEDEPGPGAELISLSGEALEPVGEDDFREQIAAADTVADASRIALDLARAAVPAESGAVILEDHGYLRFAAVTGPQSRKLVGVRLPVGTGVAGFSMSKRRSVVLSDAHQDPRHCGEVDALTGYRTEQIAVVPVVDGDTVFGVLELINLPADHRFRNDDIARLEDLAGALANRLARG